MEDIAIVTGGANGIGYACAERLKEKGAKVVLWDFDKQALEEAASSLGAVPVHVDISNWASVSAAMEETLARAGVPTILVNSAGIAGPNTLIEDYPLDDWHQIMEINTTGTFHLLKSVLPEMKQVGYGRVVLIASVAGKEVTTLEGLGTESSPHPLQAAFIELQALQCGYCASGIITTAAAFLEESPSPTDDEIKQALSGHLCRCGAQPRMVKAVARAAGRMRGDKS